MNADPSTGRRMRPDGDLFVCQVLYLHKKESHVFVTKSNLIDSTLTNIRNPELKSMPGKG